MRIEIITRLSKKGTARAKERLKNKLIFLVRGYCTDVTCNHWQEGEVYKFEVAGNPKNSDVTECTRLVNNFINLEYTTFRRGIKATDINNWMALNETSVPREGENCKYYKGYIISSAEGRFEVHTSFSAVQGKDGLIDKETGEPFDITPYVTRVED